MLKTNKKMQWLLNIQILLIINAINVIFTFTHNCVLHNKDYRCKLGTKTPYRFISNYNDSPLEYSGNTNWIRSKYCLSFILLITNLY